MASSPKDTVTALEEPATTPEYRDVTVVIPCFNHGEFVGEAVASVLAQEGPPPRIVVVDDGSTDEATHAALDALPSEVEVIRQANAGPAAARNAGIEATDSPYLLMLDADDRLPDGALAELRDALDADPEAGYAYGVMHFFGDWSGEVRLPPYDPYRLLYRGVVGWIGLVRREAWEAAGRFDPELQGFEDWDFTLGALGAGWRGKRLDLVVLDYRKHGRSGLEQDRRRYRELYRRLRSKHAALFKQAPELARESDLGPAGRLAYRTFWAWRPGAGVPRARRVLASLPAARRQAPRRRAGARGRAPLDGRRRVPRLGRPRRLRGRGRRGQHPRRPAARPGGQRRVPGHLQPDVHPGGPRDRRPRDRGRVDARIRADGTGRARWRARRSRPWCWGSSRRRSGTASMRSRPTPPSRTSTPSVALTALAALPPALLLTVFTQAAIATQRYEAAAAIGLATAIVYVAGVAALAVAFDLEGAVGGLLAGQVGRRRRRAPVVAPRPRRGGRGGLDFGRLRRAAKFGANVWFANAMVILVYRFDVFLLNAYAGASEAGYYAVAIAVSGALGRASDRSRQRADAPARRARQRGRPTACCARPRPAPCATRC